MAGSAGGTLRTISTEITVSLGGGNSLPCPHSIAAATKSTGVISIRQPSISGAYPSRIDSTMTAPIRSRGLEAPVSLCPETFPGR